MVKESGAKGVLHCFSYTDAEALPFVEQGWFVSYSGVLTFPNAKAVQEGMLKVAFGLPLGGNRCALSGSCALSRSDQSAGLCAAYFAFSSRVARQTLWRKYRRSEREHLCQCQALYKLEK